MRKEATFDWVVLRAITWVVSHSDFDSQVVDEVLQVLFEKILCRRIASATIAQQENGFGVRVTSLADTLPVPVKTVAREFARVVAQADVDMATIAKDVVDAMRNNHAGSPTGKVMVERPECLLRPHAPLSKELPKLFFCLGIEREHGVARCKVLGLQFGNPQELGVPIRAVSACQ